MHYYRAFLLAIILETSFGDKFKASHLERVVYPMLLGARGLNRETILRIEDGLVLTLEKSTVLAEDFVVIQDDGREQHMSGKELEKNLHHDRRHMSALSIEEVDGGWEVRGVLSDKLRIEPMPLKARSEDGSIAHKVSKIQKEGNYENDYIVEPDFVISERSADYEQGTVYVGEAVFVELRILCDSHHHKHHHFKSRKEVLVYLALSIIAVNLRYDALRDPRVQFLLTGVTLSGDDSNLAMVTREETSGWVTNNVTYLNSYRTIYYLSELIRNKTLEVPADALLVVTALDMVRISGGILYKNTMGLAFIGSLCGVQRVLAVEDTPGLFRMIDLAVHELGHSCGSLHDGDVQNEIACGPNGGYIMVPFVRPPPGNSFSSCSKTMISNYMKSLPEECVEVKSKINHLKDIKDLPGSGMSKSVLCKRLYPEGGDSGLDTGNYPDCRAYCMNNNHFWSYENLWDGMQCGRGKICLGGECVKTPPKYLSKAKKKKRRKIKRRKETGSL
ncbi:venom metalloproteinase antarease-like TtrivMP_A [Ixodes scapularis]|uniref:venom metalloproteinase antarease-like TtrivMP_A n=1 Tax=Ixodes scapularis TaxID=6945 RepID=UPI001C38B08A|nr:venom metalloproteinase antarease-like TtrivMP_A [Ixodes scapularis]